MKVFLPILFLMITFCIVMIGKTALEKSSEIKMLESARLTSCQNLYEVVYRRIQLGQKLTQKEKKDIQAVCPIEVYLK